MPLAAPDLRSGRVVFLVGARECFLKDRRDRVMIGGRWNGSFGDGLYIGIRDVAYTITIYEFRLMVK